MTKKDFQEVARYFNTMTVKDLDRKEFNPKKVVTTKTVEVVKPTENKLVRDTEDIELPFNCIPMHIVYGRA